MESRNNTQIDKLNYRFIKCHAGVFLRSQGVFLFIDVPFVEECCTFGMFKPQLLMLHQSLWFLSPI